MSNFGKYVELMRIDCQMHWLLILYKVCSEKKFTHICMYYANSGRASVKSLRSAKSRHPEDSKLVRQVLIIQKILPENVIEQKKIFL